MFIRTDLQSPIFLYSFFLSSVVLLSFPASVCVRALVSVWVVRAVFNISDPVKAWSIRCLPFTDRTYVNLCFESRLEYGKFSLF